MTDTEAYKSDAEQWNRAFTDSDIFHWQVPHELIQAYVEQAGPAKERSVLDIGSGYGRHTLLFAERGYRVVAMDIATTCLERLATISQERNAPFTNVIHDMNTYPYPFEDDAFDVIIGANSIHHTNAHGLQQTINEIKRILRPGGVLFIIAPSKPLDKGSTHKYVEENTAVPVDGPEAGVIHHFITEETAKALLSDFDIVRLYLDESRHWFIQAQLR